MEQQFTMELAVQNATELVQRVSCKVTFYNDYPHL